MSYLYIRHVLYYVDFFFVAKIFFPTCEFLVTNRGAPFCFRAVNQLNGVDVEGKPLKVELAVEKRARRGPRGPGAPFGGLPGQSRQTDFPLRILVQSDMVSAWDNEFNDLIMKVNGIRVMTFHWPMRIAFPPPLYLYIIVLI